MAAGERGRGWRLFAVPAVLLSLTTGGVFGQELRFARGTSLLEVLETLRGESLELVFSDRLVTPQLELETALEGTDARWLLELALSQHGLGVREEGDLLVVVDRDKSEGTVAGAVRARDGTPVAGASVRARGGSRETRTGPDGRFSLALPLGEYELLIARRGYVVARLEGVRVRHGETVRTDAVLDRAPVTEEEVVVTPSRISLLREAPAAPVALSRDDLEALPHLGGDVFRALSLLPGITGNDVSASFSVRGGRRDETRVLLDGQELFETYHLKDFDNALSVVPSRVLESVELSTGGFPAEHGDRMSGVLDMVTIRPSGPRQTEIGLSLLSLEAGSAGSFQGERGRWLGLGRRGSIDLASRLLGNEDPRFWDAFGKLEFDGSATSSWRLNALHGQDELEFAEVSEDGEKQTATDYLSSYAWLTHTLLASPTVLIESALSSSRIERERTGFEAEEDGEITVEDRRTLEVEAFRSDLRARVGSRHSIKVGGQLRRFVADYDYASTNDFINPLAVIREPPNEEVRFVESFDEQHAAGYFSGRLQGGGTTTTEVGLRYDHHSQTNESLWSPRINVARNLGGRSIVRAAWGRFHQSQRPYELLVEDGETSFRPVERAEHRVVGYERVPGGDGRGVGFRLEIYERPVSNPLPRYENLYESLNTFPELEPDRVVVAPGRSRARGVELSVRGRPGRRVGWWLNYAWSSSEDRIPGGWIPRPGDQPHSFSADLDLRLGGRWTLNAAWRFHSGWPTTPIRVEQVIDEEGEVEFVPVLGERASERLPDYHRLDLRLARSWRSPSASWSFWIDVQNLYDRGNVAGFDIEIDEDTGMLDRIAEEWAGILPSAGLRVTF